MSGDCSLDPNRYAVSNLKPINLSGQYCHLTLKNRRCIHDRRWSLSTGHFLHNQTASCHNYGSRWSEREKNRWTNRHSLIIFHQHSLSVFDSSRHLARMLLVIFKSPLMILMLFFFSFENGIFPQGSWRWGSTKWNKAHLNNSCSDEMCDLVFTQTIFNIVREGAFLTWCAYLLAGICSHRPRLSSLARVYCQRRR